MQETLEAEKSLDQITFALFDVETTGLSPAYGHRVCEVACIRVRAGSEVGRIESLVNPGRTISPGAYEVNRIESETLAEIP